jgi:hypothetical protein
LFGRSTRKRDATGGRGTGTGCEAKQSEETESGLRSLEVDEDGTLSNDSNSDDFGVAKGEEESMVEGERILTITRRERMVRRY